ncbi:TM0106 family RecB-like putative nuclease [Gramella sp. GC03-9]|uniref:TM0106 family RecB-like putative nuclease n=1 Tax=Christiangramia oceanisediminis TaxID=2920386 RepID=A0A9X2I371_9FLAO|nr:TM0106 family RecB-like putative nuclease [Gramella oceanisediminis]MCP9199015.1 TM0106 family RecB-like putative nuclease [Gramella oceanisediminis]
MKYKNNQIIYSPTDLSSHSSCNHLSNLNILNVRGEIADPEVYTNRVMLMLREKGEEFEENHLREMKEQGKTVSEIKTDDPHAEQHTIDAMKAGIEVIYQARLKEDGKWSGWADFLKKVNKPSNLGNWSYEVWDTKLANETKAGTILQIGLYSERLAHIQGLSPEFMGVIKPEGEERYRYDEHAAYIRLVKRNLEEAIANNQATYPEPTSHCDVCRWWKHCNAIRRRDDHLTFVAGISKSQIKELSLHDVSTLEKLAALDLPIPFDPSKGVKETYNKLREQARLQNTSRKNNYEPIYETLEIEDDKGLNKLPEPSPNDIYLDFEGDRMVEPDGLEYMIGYVHNGKYRALWAKNEKEEKKIFEQFIDFASKLKKEDPSLHIYHYAPYEVTALKRLMGKYASRENEIDTFLRSNTFIDLYNIVRQSLIASVEKYSIKDLEVFFGYERQMDLRELSSQKSQLELLLQTGNFEKITMPTKNAVQLYNQDDCESLVRLQAWLEIIRTRLIEEGENITRPEEVNGEASDKITEHQERIKPIMDALLENVPPIKAERSEVEQANYILAHMLDWYRRENKSFWWEFFRLKELPEDELLEERKAISFLEYTGNRVPEKRSFVDTYKFPPQECDLRAGNNLEDQENNKLGTIHEIDLDENILTIKKGPSKLDLPHPTSVMSLENVNSKTKEEAIIRLAEWVVANGMDSDNETYKAARQLLMNAAPSLSEERVKKGDTLQQTLDFASKLNKSYLPVQGPPGAGKSFTGSHLIVRLVKQGKKIGITALSHKVITNLLNKIWEVAQEEGLKISILQKTEPDPENDSPWTISRDENTIQAAIGKVDIIAGTSFMWSKQPYEGIVDYLFVDEAGQLSLIDTLSVSHCCSNLVLLGDPQQLKQPQQGVHPDGTEISALEHVLQDDKTISDDRGIFLAETWRMHSSINNFVSELFYENKLRSKDHLEQQQIINSKYAGAGLYLEEIEHTGNTNSSVEEVDIVVKIVKHLTSDNVEFIDEKGKKAILTANEIKIITPYNAQVQAIKQHLPNLEVGTVDKFQGQEAPVIIYSVATSSLEEAPRGMDFLFSPNRFNVAVSRARTCFIMVASPAIFKAECKSPLQIKLANAFCRYKEIAHTP